MYSKSMSLFVLMALIFCVNADYFQQPNLNLSEYDVSTPLDVPSAEVKLDGLELKIPNAEKEGQATQQQWQNFISQTNNMFVDKRMTANNPQFTPLNSDLQQWIEIYKKYADSEPIQYIPLTKPFRMITEVRPPKDENELKILNDNLTYYKSQGYDSVLVSFDINDNFWSVISTIKHIKNNFQMNVWLTYSGDESLNTSVFMNVNEYTQILGCSANLISGYVNSWRKTSAHLWEQDMAFMNYTNHVLREFNPRLPIIGEIYYGNSHKFQSNQGFSGNVCPNLSGLMIVNFGYRNVNVKYLLDKIIRPKYPNIPIVGVVVGQRAYYLTTNANKLNYQQNMAIKHRIENDFIKNGYIGTITLSDDGKKIETNNLSKTFYTKLGN